MIEKKPISFAVVGRCLSLPGKKLYRWYKEVFSGFTEPENQIELRKYDTIDPKLTDYQTGEVKTVAVPILKSENVGPDMAIDDKNIGGEGYTIMANKRTGKIALLAQTTKADILAKILRKMPVKILFLVKTISKDLAENYDWLARTTFMAATRIADKFHVLKLAFEALQDVRIRYRQQALTEERKKREQFKAQERERKEQCRRTGETYIKQKLPKVRSKRYANGETKKELLAKSRYLLFSFEKDWRESQKERADILFKEFPEIKKAYKLICSFRVWYNIKVGNSEKAKLKLREWYKQVGKQDIEELNNFASTVEQRETEILNYFDKGHTNAMAESLNSQIQSLVKSNSGTRDRDFFHFRMKRYFS